MADKADKADKSDKKADVKDAAPKDEPPPSKEALLAQLLGSYLHNMEHAAPRTLEELQIIQQLAAP